MLTICTGMSGSGAKEYILASKKIAESRGEKLEVISVGEQMYKKSKELGYPIPKGTILDTSDRYLDCLRATVFEEILRIKGETKNLVVDTHACFRWHKHLTKAFDYYYLHKLDPDQYITITDTVYSIYGRLQGTQWKGRNSLAELLAWRDEEEFVTKTFASIQKKPHFVIARDEPPETLYNLIFKPRMKRAYISYPISAAETERLKKVQKVIEELRKSLIVFDPMSIKDVDWLTLELARKKKGETETSIPYIDYDNSKKEIKMNIEELEQIAVHLKDQTVYRDYTFISQSDFVAVYYYDPSLPSPGVQREMRYAKDNGKSVYLYYPKDTMSPFQEMDITQHFQDEKGFMNFLKKIQL